MTITKDTRLLVEPMDGPHPQGCEFRQQHDYACDFCGEWNFNTKCESCGINRCAACNKSMPCSIPPHAVGDLIPVREEWRVYGLRNSCSQLMNRAGDDQIVHVTIETPTPPLLRSVTLNTYCIPQRQIEKDLDGIVRGIWQPAETMPDWAVRHWLRVTKVEPEIVEDALSSDTEWQWHIEVEPETI